MLEKPEQGKSSDKHQTIAQKIEHKLWFFSQT